MDAITLLRNDHQSVEALFKRFEKAGDSAFVEKRAIVDRIIEELSVHAAIEEQVFYPKARQAVANTEDIALESLEEHHIVKWVLSELDGMDVRAERFDAKVTVLMENVRHHVQKEQTEFFPKVRAALGRKELANLGAALASAKASAPTHPHPRSPDSPPANGVVGAIAGVIDKVGDNLSGIAQGSLVAGQELVARITGANIKQTSPTGSSSARKTASSTKKSLEMAGRRTTGAARAAADGASSTLVTAKAGVKTTATTAKQAATRTARSVQRGATSTASAAQQGAKKTAGAAKQGAKKTAGAAKR